jgi:leucine-zipper of insertion element IS481
MIMIERIAAGWPIAHVAAEMGVARKTPDKWWRRWLAEGEAGLVDRSSRPHRCPHQTSGARERRIVRLRQTRKLGPARIASIVGMPASTVHRVLCRHGLNRLAWMDRPIGQVIRRIHTDRPGELVHIDVKKLGRADAPSRP